MKVAIMQPYLFPYLGYFQLVNAVDTFVFFDDVNFIMKGWINRNNILQKDCPCKFTLPLKKASQNKLINEVEILDYKKWRSEFLRLISYNYSKAPFYKPVYEWLDSLLSSRDHTFISELSAASVEAVATLLNMKTAFMYSTKLNYQLTSAVSGQDKILSICSLLGAKSYINPRNGSELYEESRFRNENLQLKFIHMHDVNYKQFYANSFVPNLSILDALMFNSKEQVKDLLELYTLR